MSRQILTSPCPLRRLVPMVALQRGFWGATGRSERRVSLTAVTKRESGILQPAAGVLELL